MLARLSSLALILGIVGVIGCGGPEPVKSNLPESKELKSNNKKASAVSDSSSDLPSPSRKQ